MTAAETPEAPYASEARRRRMLERLLRTVEALLSSGTAYADLSVAAIISDAKIARSTFYAYYDGKGPLLRSIGADVITRVIGASRPWFEFPDEGTEADLRVVFGDLFDVYREHSVLLAAMAESASADADVRSEFFRMIEVGQTEIGRHVRRGQRAGSIAADVDPVATVSWLVWMLERSLYELVRNASTRQLARHVEACTGVVWSTLYAGARG